MKNETHPEDDDALPLSSVLTSEGTMIKLVLRLVEYMKKGMVCQEESTHFLWAEIRMSGR